MPAYGTEALRLFYLSRSHGVAEWGIVGLIEDKRGQRMAPIETDDAIQYST